MRDVFVFAQGSQPIHNRGEIVDGIRYAVRVAVYLPGSQIDLSGNTWSSTDPTSVKAKTYDVAAEPSLGATEIIEPFEEGGVSPRTTSFGHLKSMFH